MLFRSPRFLANCIYRCVQRQKEYHEYGIRSSVKAFETHIALLKKIEGQLRYLAKRPGVVREVYENALDREARIRNPVECEDPEHPAFLAPFAWFASKVAFECASTVEHDPKARLRAIEACNELRGTPYHKSGEPPTAGDPTMLRVTLYSEDGSPQQTIEMATARTQQKGAGDD